MSSYSVVVYLYPQGHNIPQVDWEAAVVAVVKLFIPFIKVVPKSVESDKTTTNNTDTPHLLFIIIIAPNLTFLPPLVWYAERTSYY